MGLQSFCGGITCTRSSLSDAQLEASAKDAVALWLARNLLVPKVFFDAHWPAANPTVDVLAIDRAGTGDIHVASVKVGIAGVQDKIAQTMRVPAHYKYVAIVKPRPYRPQSKMLYSPDGMGRIGILFLEEGPQNRLILTEAVPAERFRVTQDVIRRIDKFTAKQPADIEVRV